MLGVTAHVTTQFAGTSTVGVEAVGQTVISVDSLSNFALDIGVVVIDGTVYTFNSVDRDNVTLTLGSPLIAEAPAGTDVRQFPSSLKRWAFVESDNSSTPTDAVWAIIPHDLAAFFAQDGPREVGSKERVRVERQGTQMVIVDVFDRVPQLNSDSIPDGLITETKIAPESITTPLLASNAVATQHLQFGAATGDKLAVDALNGKVITGALIRSAAEGKRVEFTNSGLVQIDENGAIVLSIGDQNKFTGSIDAFNITIRDGLELFGKNNYVKTGAEIVLATGQGGSVTAPTLTNFYEVSPQNIAQYLSTTIGVFTDAAEGRIDRGTNFFSFSHIYKGTAKYGFPTVTRSDGSGVCSVDVQAYTRIRHSGGERAVVLAYAHPEGETPETKVGMWLNVYDDNSMLADGSVPPTYKAGVSFQYAPSFSWFRSITLGKCWGTSGMERMYALAEMINDTSTAYVNLKVHEVVNDTTSNSIASHSNVPFPLSASDERITGVAYGTLGAMKFLPSGHPQFSVPVWVIMTSHKNLIWSAIDLSATGRYTGLEWPITPTQQYKSFTFGSLTDAVNGFARFANTKAGAELTPSPQKIVRYSNVTWDNTENPIWAQFSWKGDASKVSPEWITSPSTMSAPLSRIKRAQVMISVPPLPTPSGGVGVARNVNLDVYSWAYYIGQGVGAPLRTAMWRQNNSPVPATTVATTVQNVTLPDTLAVTGTNPFLATQGFTALTPARFVSSAGDGNGPFLVIDGDGNIKAKTADITTLNDAGVVGLSGTLSSVQSIPNNAWTTVANWGGLQYLPTQAPSELALVPIGGGQWRCDNPGWYDIRFGFGLSDSTGSRFGGIAVDGSRRVSQGFSRSGFESGGFISHEFRLTAAQVVAFHVYHNTGSAINLVGLAGAEYRTWFSIRRIRA